MSAPEKINFSDSGGKKERDEKLLEEACALLRASPEGKKLLKELKEDETEIVIDPDLPPRMGGYHQNGCIAVSSNFIHRHEDPRKASGEAAFIIAHEAGHARQHKACSFDYMRNNLSGPGNLYFTRFLEPHAHSLAIQIGWELKEAGVSSNVWEASLAKGGWLPLREAFENAAEKRPGAVGDGTARRAAMDAFPDTEIRKAYDLRASTKYAFTNAPDPSPEQVKAEASLLNIFIRKVAHREGTKSPVTREPPYSAETLKKKSIPDKAEKFFQQAAQIRKRKTPAQRRKPLQGQKPTEEDLRKHRQEKGR